MKTRLLIGIVLAIVALLLSACGAPQEERDAVVAEPDVAQAEVTSLQNQLTSAQSDLTTTQSDLATAQSDLAEKENDLASTQDRLSSLQSQISSLRSDLAATEAQVTELEEVIIARFVGVWLNEDPNTDSITRVEIRRVGNELVVHMWGACYPSDCDWGEQRIDVSEAGDGVLPVTWNLKFGVETQEITLTFDDRLDVKGNMHFTDNSGRADYSSVDRFLRQ